MSSLSKEDRDKTKENKLNCLLCEKPLDKKGARVHDLTWNAKEKSYRKNDKGQPDPYVMPLHRDCVWKGYQEQKSKEGAVA